MRKLFLTSSVHLVAKDIAGRVDLSVKKKLVFIVTPAENKSGDMSWLKRDMQSLVDAVFEVVEYTITGKDKVSISNDLKDFDYIYMSGGDSFYLLEHSQKSGFVDLVRDWVNKEGKVYIGTSAGSIISGDKVPDYLVDDVSEYDISGTEGYGFVNFIMMPHWGSEQFKSKYMEKRMALAYKEVHPPYILLTDSQYVYIEDDMMKIVDVSKI